jgi:hypothetical protein
VRAAAIGIRDCQAPGEFDHLVELVSFLERIGSTDGGVASALKPASHRSDTCNNGVCASHAAEFVARSSRREPQRHQVDPRRIPGSQAVPDSAPGGLAAEQTDNPATQVSCPTGDDDHFFAHAGETQRRTRPIIIWTASSGLTPSLRTSCFQVWKSSARASTARRC